MNAASFPGESSSLSIKAPLQSTVEKASNDLKEESLIVNNYEPDPKDDENEEFPGLSQWLKLLLILGIATCYSVQKYTLAYAYGYQASDAFHSGNPEFEITAF